jgi:hypothetical protein
MHVAASGTSVAVKRRAVNRLRKVRTSLYMYIWKFCLMFINSLICVFNYIHCIFHFTIVSIFRMCCQFQFFTIAVYTSYTFSVSNAYLHFCLKENNKKICYDNQSPDSRYRGNSNSVRYIKFTSNKGQKATRVYNLSNTVTHKSLENH